VYIPSGTAKLARTCVGELETLPSPLLPPDAAAAAAEVSSDTELPKPPEETLRSSRSRSNFAFFSCSTRMRWRSSSSTLPSGLLLLSSLRSSASSASR